MTATEAVRIVLQLVAFGIVWLTLCLLAGTLTARWLRRCAETQTEPVPEPVGDDYALEQYQRRVREMQRMRRRLAPAVRGR